MPHRRCARRIILPVNDGRLFALDADTGQTVPDFANNGELNLQSNMPYATPGHYEPTSPPVITDKVIVIAGAVTDNYSNREPSGVIRGFDVNSGKLRGPSIGRERSERHPGGRASLRAELAELLGAGRL